MLRFFLCLTFASFLFLPCSFSQIPQLINYQGRVAVSGTNFNGTGQFKFALVNAAGNVTYWSNNGSSSNGGEPTAAVALPVTNGLYSVLLGDASLSNMTVVPAAVFNNPDVRLRVWFSDGLNGSQQLVPDQRIAAVGYAVIAGGVPAGAITSSMIAAGAVQSGNIANGAVGSTQLANGAVGSAQLAPGAAAANLNAGGQSGVGSGGIILSAIEDPALVAAGYVRIGTTTLADSWQRRTDSSPPSARSDHTAVWTGSEMIVWGGDHEGALTNDGRRYNPATNSWLLVSMTNAPGIRYLHTAVWTGTDMIVWGGIGVGYLNDGGRYNPAADLWTAISLASAPAGRYAQTAIWTGGEMIVWGGRNSSGYLADGGRYTPSSDLWGPPLLGAALNAPSPRSSHTAVWSGSEMIIWGGYSGTADLGNGARFNPSTSVWSLVATGGAVPSARHYATAVWTGSEMIVWGGRDNNGYFADGGRYNPSANTWANVTSSGAPIGRTIHTAVWTGAEMMVWGGVNNIVGTTLGDGGRYSPATGAWTPIPTANAPSARDYHSAVWTGTEMIVWGGHNETGFPGDGGRFSAALGTWTAIGSATAGSAIYSPTERELPTALWTGSEMIVWGGSLDGIPLQTGGRYSPTTNTWTPVSTIGAPSGRLEHTAVWTGTEMVVWGGYSGVPVNDGGRYNPAADGWTTMASSPLAARYEHTAIWTGSVMVTWGGFGSTSLSDGAIYRPSNDTWVGMAVSPLSARYRQTAIWSGSEMIIWGGYDGTNYFGNGGRFNPVANTWGTTLPAGALNEPSARYGHAAVWTGSEMIVWGGDSSGIFKNDGGRYNPATSTWGAPLLGTAPNAPAARSIHTAIWTGTEMIVWGGSRADGSELGDGGSFNPAAGGSWASGGVSSGGPPVARHNHTAIWTGTEMIIWGGFNNESATTFRDGGRYNPATQAWKSVAQAAAVVSPPPARYSHSAIWTGSEMVVWGGYRGGPLGDGARFNPAVNSWKATTSIGAPAARYQHTAVWSGTEMIVWGGLGMSAELNDGARYNVTSDSWSVLPVTANTPSARRLQVALWSGSDMLVWGGYNGSAGVGTGGRYNPTTDVWTAISDTNAPTARWDHSGVWTGSEMIIWGGYSGSAGLNNGARYNPANGIWTPVSQSNAPSSRYLHSAIWTGSLMIVWGGFDGVNYPNTSQRYQPSTDTWIPMTTSGAPASRAFTTSVWTGSEMLVWGGGDSNNTTFTNAGGRYNATTDTWSAITLSAAPPARALHTSIWTGTEMIVFGGYANSTALGDTYSYTPGQTMFLYQRP